MRIEDEMCALDFDATCTTRLLFYDRDKEQAMCEALGVGQVTREITNATGGLSGVSHH